MEARGALPPKLKGLKEELVRLPLADADERAQRGRAAAKDEAAA
jgi:hypothetical protein